jgi:IclR family transcriptional regulator, KDG regulon repressor
MKQIGPLDKAFQILQFLSDAPQAVHPLGRIAEALQLNKATCAHVLRKLTDLNYVEQLGPRKGYRLGPMAYALSRKGPYRRDLVAVAEPVMDHLAEGVREAVLLIMLRGATRFTLCHVQCDREVRVDESVTADTNVYATVTGRLLLSHASADDLDTFVDRNGLPGEQWPEVRTMSDLVSALAEIRASGGPLVVARDETAAIACPVHEDGRMVAALGLYLPKFRFKGEHRKAVLDGLGGAAAEISLRLGSPMGSEEGR